MLLKLLFGRISLHDNIAFGLCELQVHRLIEQIESLNILDCLCCGSWIFEDYESLSFPLQTALGYDVEDGAIFAEDLAQVFNQIGDLDALFKIADLELSQLQSRCAM